MKNGRIRFGENEGRSNGLDQSGGTLKAPGIEYSTMIIKQTFRPLFFCSARDRYASISLYWSNGQYQTKRNTLERTLLNPPFFL